MGPFSGRQLTVMVVALVIGVLGYPIAAGAASAIFKNNSSSVPAVQGTNTNASGVGVEGTGKRFGVFSNGPLGVANGRALSCHRCVGLADLANAQQAYCSGIPHESVVWDIPGSKPGLGCYFNKANLAGANMGFSDMTNIFLLNADLHGAVLQYAAMHGAFLGGANLTAADLNHAHLVGATVTYTNLTSANLSGADLRDATLQGATTAGADVTGVNWQNTTCPDNTNSDADGDTCVGHGF